MSRNKNWGGKREGSGRKKGTTTGPIKAEREKRKQLAVSFPAYVVERLKNDKKNISKYLLALVEKDYISAEQELHTFNDPLKKQNHSY